MKKPSRVRWRIAALLLAMTSLMYVDRLNISVAAAHIQNEFGLTSVQIGTILSAFVLGYALFQIPGGVLTDLIGPKRMLALAILCWSLSTILTALGPELPLARWLGLSWSFVVLRSLVGVGEAPALPAANKLIGLWMPPQERALGNGIFIAGFGLGGALTPPLIVWLMETWGWRASFWVTGLLGLPLLAVWLSYVTTRPEEHRRVNSAELTEIRGSADPASDPAQRSPVPWRALLSRGSIWALVVSYFLSGYFNYVFFTWYFLYVLKVRHLSVTHASFWAMTPFIAMTVLSPVGGYASDRAVRRFGVKWGRRLPVFLGTAIAALLMVVGAHAQSSILANVLMALAAGASAFALVNWWATTVDITRRFAGSLAGIMNTAGNLGGVISPTLTPYLAERFSWMVALSFAAVTALLAGILWFFVRPDEALEA